MGVVEIGTLISNRYQIVEHLGDGGMASVYKALDCKNGERPVALKFLHRVQLCDPTIIARFRNEVMLCQSLSHPGVVEVYDFVELEYEKIYIAMEYVDGASLGRLIHKDWAAIELKRIVQILCDVAEALAHAHSHGIVHRDLKPDNILIRKDGAIKIVDFGLARNIEVGFSLTASGESVGTPFYMAPEQLRGERADPRIDIYALGVIGYEMAAGKRPFDSDNFVQLAAMHLTQPVPDLSSLAAHIPGWFQDFVEVCMEKNPASRYKSMEQVSLILKKRLKKLEQAAGPRRWFS